MNSKLFMVVALLSVGFSAYAGQTVCANSRLYYVDSTNDGGAAPRPGSVIGSTFIMYGQKVLLKKDKIAGLGQFSPGAYRVELGENSVALETTGNQTHGTSVFKTTATIYKGNSVNMNNKKEITKEDVVCLASFAVMP